MTNNKIATVLGISARQVSKSQNDKGSQHMLVKAFIKQLKKADQEANVIVPENILEKIVKER